MKDAATGIDVAIAFGRWHFDWLAGAPGEPQPNIRARVTGRLRWRGVDLTFAVDGLEGIDGRLSAPSLELLASPLQQVVLKHFADECLRAMAHGPLADMTLVEVEWHASPEPLTGQFAFMLRRPGVRGSSRGAVSAFTAAGRAQLRDALAAHGWPVPREMAMVAGRLHIGSVQMTLEEATRLEAGDLVWIDDAELSPAGLHARFRADAEDAGCAVWLKRGAMTRDTTPIAQWVEPQNSAPSLARSLTPGSLTRLAEPDTADAAVMRLDVVSPWLSVERSWLQGARTTQRLHATALSIAWQVRPLQNLPFEGRLLVVGRRLALRVTKTQARMDKAIAAPSTKD